MWIVCAWAVEKSFGWSLDLQRLSPCPTGKVGHLWAQWSVWHLSNIFGIFWRAQDLPSRSGQLCIIYLVPALEKVRKFGRPRLQGSPAIVPELFRPKRVYKTQKDSGSNQSLLAPVFKYYLFPSKSALEKWTSGHLCYDICDSLWTCRHACTHLVNHGEFTPSAEG